MATVIATTRIKAKVTAGTITANPSITSTNTNTNTTAAMIPLAITSRITHGTTTTITPTITA